MEIEGDDGGKLELENGKRTVFGRKIGFNTDDGTVSHHHVAFELEEGTSQTEPGRVSFEVLGKNPIWVRSRKDGEIRVFRRFEKGELEAGDWFCVSWKRPVWFTLRKTGVEVDLAETSRIGSEIEDVDVSGIDPVKEFGFVVLGHEFDLYPKHMIRDIKRWNWFLEEARKDSDDDGEEYEKKGKRVWGKKRKKGEENEDDEWTGDSEDDSKVVANVRKGNRQKYVTRSKDSGKPLMNDKGGRNSVQKKVYDADEEEEEEEEEEDDNDDDDDDDEVETLGGFIVGDDDVEKEEEMDEDEDDEEEEEEEEFEEEEDE
ncbi:hypothetical protein UlMin_011898 [Ulmus minor]